MKNSLLKFLTPTLIIFGVFILPKISFASTIVQQTDYSSSTTLTLANSAPYLIQGLGTGITGSIGYIDLYMQANGSTSYGLSIGVMDCPTQGFTFGGSCVNRGSSTTVPYSLLTTLGVHRFNFPTPAVASSTRWTYLLISPNWAGLPSLTFYGTASTSYPNYTCQWYNLGSYYSCSNIRSLYFVTDNGAVQPGGMTIDSPATGSFISTASNITVSGKCLNIGANQLEITTTPFLARLDPPSKFNITCNSDFTYSTTFKPLIGYNGIWIIDKSVIGEMPPNIYNTGRYATTAYTGYAGSANGLSWLLTLEYPPDNGSHAFVINPNTTQQFRFRFKVPDDSVKPQGRIKTILWTNSSRTVASTTNEFIGLDSLDLDGDGLLGLNVGPVPDGQTWYYTQYLENGTTVMYDIPFSVYASSTAQSAGTTVNPAAPDDRQYGPCLNLPLIGLNNFCLGTAFYALTIPNPRFTKDDVNDTYGLMQTKIPFAFYYQLKDQLSGVTASSTDFTYNIPVNLASSTGVSLNIPFSSNNSGVHNVRSALDPWFKAFAWFYFAWWAYRKAINFHF
jgi:hypothetical protein